MLNALCIDLEPWYLAEFVKKYIPDSQNEQNDLIYESILPILNLLDRYNVRATFAVLGIVAEKYPDLVKNISEKGHEIASHAYSHKTLHELGEKNFEEEIVKSISLLEGITGKKPIGFRAPSFSINNSTRWAFSILQKYGFKYDASVFPIRTNLYGVPNAPLHIYRPSRKDVSKIDSQEPMIEFPMPVFRFGWNIPVTGGFYFRALPLFYQKLAIQRINRTRPVVLYIHPWETYSHTPKLRQMSYLSRFITYYAINKSLKKFEELLKTFKFTPISSIIDVAHITGDIQ